jgi:hypothetical protein
MKFTLDATKARDADRPQATRISESGAYTGIITLAKHIIANSGSQGIEFAFQADDGATAKYLRLYTSKADGSEIFGHGIVLSAMTCLRLKELDSETITIEEWDFNAKCNVPVEAEVYSALCNKPIGVVLQKVLKDGDKFSMNISGFFDAKSRMTASEILDKATVAKALDAKLHHLKDKDERTPGGYDGGVSAPTPAPASHPVNDPFGADAGDLSDLPF